jgi:hypothetical protein
MFILTADALCNVKRELKGDAARFLSAGTRFEHVAGSGMCGDVDTIKLDTGELVKVELWAADFEPEVACGIAGCEAVGFRNGSEPGSVDVCPGCDTLVCAAHYIGEHQRCTECHARLRVETLTEDGVWTEDGLGDAVGVTYANQEEAELAIAEFIALGPEWALSSYRVVDTDGDVTFRWDSVCTMCAELDRPDSTAVIALSPGVVLCPGCYADEMGKP